MSWWLIPSIFIVAVAGVGAGLVISYFVLKRQNKSFLLFQKQRSVSITVDKRQTSGGKPRLITKIEPKREKIYEAQAKSVTLAEDTLEKYVSKAINSQSNRSAAVTERSSQSRNSTGIPEKSPPISISSDVPEKNPQGPKTPGIPYRSAAILELESNLETARLPVSDKLSNFKTEVWNTRRSEFNVASPQLLSELTEAYVDMLLANNIVWLVTELGRDSKDLRESYSDLKTKVADRLERVVPQVKESLQ